MSQLSYQGVNFTNGDRLLMEFDNLEWVVFEIPSTWDDKGLPLDDTGFLVVDEILYPDSVTVLHGRDVGFPIDTLTQLTTYEEISGYSSYILAGRKDGTLLKFKSHWTDDEGFYTSSIIGFDVDITDSQTGWRLIGEWR